ncbi:MAG: hypothetical protein M0Z61_15160 [Nitrospiraceae bacterium]|nr:hypothetical protein [Nitrospiraceae bacterium]
MKLGKYCYTDFVFSILDYFSILNKKEFAFEWIPPIIAALAAYIFGKKYATDDFLKTFLSLITNVFAILVGFTIAAIAIFASIDIEKNGILNKKSDREIRGKEISYFRFVFINLVFSAVVGIIMLAAALFSFFMMQFIENAIVLSLIVFGTVFNLLAAIRNTTNLYFVLFKRVE